MDTTRLLLRMYPTYRSPEVRSTYLCMYAVLCIQLVPDTEKGASSFDIDIALGVHFEINHARLLSGMEQLLYDDIPKLFPPSAGPTSVRMAGHLTK